MTKTYAAPADYSEEPYVAIPMTPVVSNQIAAIGYSLERKTLAVTFTLGAGAIYHYQNVTPEQHAAFVGAESIGKHFGAYIQPLAFKKFPPVKPVEAKKASEETTSTTDTRGLSSAAAWPFPTLSAETSEAPVRRIEEPAAIESGGGGNFGGGGAESSWSDSSSSSSSSDSCSASSSD